MNSKQIRKALTLTTLNYYETHLSIINCLLPHKSRLTPAEIRVLAAFLSFPNNSPSTPNSSINSTSRKYALSHLNISDSGLSNHLRNLSFKDIISNDTIIPILIPNSSQVIYTFKLTNYGT